MGQNEIRFFVKDIGVGIRQEVQKKLFKSSPKQETDYLKSIKGLESGLPASKRLVKIMGGEIGLNSKYNNRAEFHFNIPFNSPPFDPSAGKPDSGIVGKTSGNTILIVDDEPLNLMLLEMLLHSFAKTTENDSLKIYKADNGKKAVELCKKYTAIDIVLMDIKMPVMDGLEATALIKSDKPEVKVIALTAFNSEESRTKAKEAGCDDYLTKPICREALFSLLKKYITNNKLN